jgi:hypothetical protein
MNCNQQHPPALYKTLNVLTRYGDAVRAEYRPAVDWLEVRVQGASQHHVNVSKSVAMVGDQIILGEHRRIKVAASSLEDARDLVKLLGGSVRRFRWFGH